jgi:hypothetical protein
MVLIGNSRSATLQATNNGWAWSLILENRTVQPAAAPETVLSAQEFWPR